MNGKEFYTSIGIKKKSVLAGTIVYCDTCKMHVELPHTKHKKEVKK